MILLGMETGKELKRKLESKFNNLRSKPTLSWEVGLELQHLPGIQAYVP
jgi:hypothetical protein